MSSAASTRVGRASVSSFFAVPANAKATPCQTCPSTTDRHNIRHNMRECVRYSRDKQRRGKHDKETCSCGFWLGISSCFTLCHTLALR